MPRVAPDPASEPTAGLGRLRRRLWWLVGLVAFAAVVIFVVVARDDGRVATSTDRLELKPIAGMGGPFSLVDQHGAPFTEKSLEGKPTLLFFGYTFCPDVCPTTLLEVGLWMQQLGVDADQLRVVFITVDPERDTPEKLSAYLASFDPRFVGLSGPRAEIDKAIKAWRVYARKVEGKGGDYTMDHTAAVYMLDRQGRFVGLIKFQEEQKKVIPVLRRLLAQG